MFYIVQMADFHFGGDHPGPESEKDILEKMAKKIQNVIPPRQKVVLCGCGDYIDSKQVLDKSSKRMRNLRDKEVKSRYQDAKETLQSAVITPLSKTYDFDFGLCVGNHDTTHIDEVNQLSKDLGGGVIHETYRLYLDSDNVDLIFINSCPPADHSHGEIDYKSLEDTLKSLPKDSAKYLIMHHALISMDENDQSSIRQVPELIKLIDQYAIKAVFHGHTHSQYAIRVGTVGCPLIGVGAAYVRNYSNVNSQFNLICCKNGVPVSADNYQYHADLAMNPGDDGFRKNPISISKENNFFCGRTFSGVYHNLIEILQAESKLYNVHLQVKSSFTEFRSDVETHFGNKIELKTLDQEYSYSQLAEMWEAPQLDKNVLYFNHGMYFCSEQYPSGIDYIIHEIGEKITSSRAVLVTSNTKDIAATAPDALLPSLLSIQFGFGQEHTTLHITMNLRALEASRFLKINICEILLLAKQLYKKYPFHNIEVVISAFRVQIKKNFSCFLKAKLDTLAQTNKIAVNLSSLIYSDTQEEITQKVEYIVRLIEDKKQRTETVIETAGIENLLRSIADVKTELSSNKKALRSKFDLVYTYTEELLAKLNKLKEKRASSSEQTENMASLEEEIEQQYNKLINGLERLKEI